MKQYIALQLGQVAVVAATVAVVTFVRDRKKKEVRLEGRVEELERVTEELERVTGPARDAERKAKRLEEARDLLEKYRTAEYLLAQEERQKKKEEEEKEAINWVRAQMEEDKN
jgi:predicted ribosome quality control (RQC) complex YloA/Tae2 family protein